MSSQSLNLIIRLSIIDYFIIKIDFHFLLLLLLFNKKNLLIFFMQNLYYFRLFPLEFIHCTHTYIYLVFIILYYKKCILAKNNNSVIKRGH